MDWPQSCMQQWRGRPHFVIFNASHADGAPLRALLQAWRDDPQRPARLHYIALCGDALPGFRRIPQAEPGLTVDLLSATLDQACSQLDARLDAIVLDTIQGAGSRFAHALGRLAVSDATLVAHGLDFAQRAALSHAGFAWEGEHCARFTSRRPQAAPRAGARRERRAIVLGAGLAGAAACERLVARGWRVTLVERHAQPASEASGNLAGISMPLLSRDDNLMTRLSRAAFRYALDYWDALGANPRTQGSPLVGARCGVLQLARDAGHAQVQREIAAAHRYPPQYAQWLGSAAASAMLGSSAPDGAWLFPQGGWMHPASACGAMLAACGDALERRFAQGSVSAAREDGQWCLLDAAGAPVARAPVLVLAGGASAVKLAPAAMLPLSAVRGQVTHLAAGTGPGQLPTLPFVLCREAYLTPALNGWHSLGASYDDDDDPHLRADSQQANLDKIRSLLDDPAIGIGAPLAGRVGFRCVAPDRLPLVGALPAPRPAGRIERLREVPRQDGLYGLLGYASRGLIWAPLAAELLAAQLDGEPLPLETERVQALDPARFLLREQRRKDVARPGKV